MADLKISLTEHQGTVHRSLVRNILLKIFSEEPPTMHQIKKINVLANSGIKFFTMFTGKYHAHSH